MKILLINPPSNHSAKLPGPWDAVLSQHIYAPPMGLMYLKSFIQRETDFEVRLWNAQVPDSPGLDDLSELLEKYKPEVVGITVMILNWYDAMLCARTTRKILPNAHIVMGGPHITLYPEETLFQPEIDSVVIGEGEYTFLELLNHLANKKSLEGIQGLWFKKGQDIIRNPERPFEPEPDRFPFPDRSGFDLLQHRVSADQLAPAAVVLTTRGCPYQCTFCCNLDHHYRERSAENVVEEILMMKELGYRSIDFYDDIFNVTKRRVMDICDQILKRGVNLPWICRCRVDKIDEELVARMAEAGCKRIQFGIESATQRILDEIKKHTTVEQAREAVRLAHKYGISVLGYYMFGFPGETIEEAKETIKFVFELNTDFAILHPLIPAPGSEIYKKAIEDPNFGGDNVREFARNPVPDFRFKIWETTIPEEQLFRLLSSAYLKYYFRPTYIFRSIAKLTSFEDFLAKITSAWKILYENFKLMLFSSKKTTLRNNNLVWSGSEKKKSC